MSKMKQYVYCLLTGLSVGAAQADMPVYDEDSGRLTLPAVEVNGRPGHFQNVVLEPDGNGGWVVARLDEGKLLDSQYVDSFGLSTPGGFPEQHFLNIAGTFTNGCPEVGRIHQRVESDTIHVYIHYAPNEWLQNPEGVACTLALVDFQLIIPLETYGLDAGEYAVRVNDHGIGSITLQSDNRMQRPVWMRDDCEHGEAGADGWTTYHCSARQD